jgi:hypothetical protein
VAGEVEVVMELFSPAGGTGPTHWVRVDTAAALSGLVVPLSVDVAPVRLAVGGRAFEAEGAVLDLADIDGALANRVRRGAVVLDVANPLALAGAATLRLAAPGVALERPVRIAPGETRQRLEFTGEELRALLGQSVVLTLSGAADPGVIVTLRPGDRITLATMLDLVVELGPER